MHMHGYKKADYIKILATSQVVMDYDIGNVISSDTHTPAEEGG